MTQQKPQTKPAKAKDELDDAALRTVTGGTDTAPTTTTTQSNVQKKLSDTASGIAQNMK